MLKKTITYTDYNGEKRTEDFYFNLNKAELAEMELSEKGGFSSKLKSIAETNDPSQILPIFKDIVLKAYGVKSEDGRRFIKNDQVRDEFSQTEAFSELFIELATNADAASKFIEGLLPKIDKIAPSEHPANR